MIPICRRVHGCEHDHNKLIESRLNTCKERIVGLEVNNEARIFEALRYEDEGGEDQCVLQGPITKPRNLEGETVLTVNANHLLIVKMGTPSICKGLNKSSHLNGKLGDVRSYDSASERYEVYFEDKSLKPVSVKRENLRIVFELPDVEFLS